jgi:hypothetical protein
MTVRATPEDVERLAIALDDVVRAAEQLERELRSRGDVNPEGAVEVREIAVSLATRTRAGELSGRAGALPLSRPFGEWSYGAAAEPVWQAIDAVQRVWAERLGRGDFEVTR